MKRGEIVSRPHATLPRSQPYHLGPQHDATGSKPGFSWVESWANGCRASAVSGSRHTDLPRPPTPTTSPFFTGGVEASTTQPGTAYLDGTWAPPRWPVRARIKH